MMMTILLMTMMMMRNQGHVSHLFNSLSRVNHLFNSFSRVICDTAVPQ